MIRICSSEISRFWQFLTTDDKSSCEILTWFPGISLLDEPYNEQTWQPTWGQYVCYVPREIVCPGSIPQGMSVTWSAHLTFGHRGAKSEYFIDAVTILSIADGTNYLWTWTWSIVVLVGNFGKCAWSWWSISHEIFVQFGLCFIMVVLLADVDYCSTVTHIISVTHLSKAESHDWKYGYIDGYSDGYPTTTTHTKTHSWCVFGICIVIIDTQTSTSRHCLWTHGKAFRISSEDC